MSRTKNPESQESPEDGATQGEEGERKGENLEGGKGPSRRRAESESQGSSVGKVGYNHLIQESNENTIWSTNGLLDRTFSDSVEGEILIKNPWNQILTLKNFVNR